MKQNYQLALDKTIAEIQKNGTRPSLLLHACCAPCSSYVLEYLCEYFQITLFFYNPNISPRSEYDMRYAELHRLVREMGLENTVSFADSDYTPELFFQMARGLESLPEGSERCRKCHALRLDQTARLAAKAGFDYFTTTLSISPHKNAEWLNAIGAESAQAHGSQYLFSDFKKRNGYLRSIELSTKHSLYRQSYCGCIFSKAQKEQNH